MYQGWDCMVDKCSEIVWQMNVAGWVCLADECSRMGLFGR